MRSPFLLALVVLLAPASAASQSGTCPLRGSQNFARLAALPPGAAPALAIPMAERGQPFQATDVIGPGPRLPGARFVAGRRNGCDLFIRYERGGIAHTFQTALLRFDRGRWRLVRAR